MGGPPHPLRVYPPPSPMQRTAIRKAFKSVASERNEVGAIVRARTWERERGDDKE